jgi:hypothetical protein
MHFNVLVELCIQLLVDFIEPEPGPMGAFLDAYIGDTGKRGMSSKTVVMSGVLLFFFHVTIDCLFGDLVRILD